MYRVFFFIAVTCICDMQNVQMPMCNCEMSQWRIPSWKREPSLIQRWTLFRGTINATASIGANCVLYVEVALYLECLVPLSIIIILKVHVNNFKSTFFQSLLIDSLTYFIPLILLSSSLCLNRKELVKKALDQGTPFSEWNSELVVPWLEVSQSAFTTSKEVFFLYV